MPGGNLSIIFPYYLVLRSCHIQVAEIPLSRDSSPWLTCLPAGLPYLVGTNLAFSENLPFLVGLYPAILCVLLPSRATCFCWHLCLRSLYGIYSNYPLVGPRVCILAGRPAFHVTSALSTEQSQLCQRRMSPLIRCCLGPGVTYTAPSPPRGCWCRFPLHEV